MDGCKDPDGLGMCFENKMDRYRAKQQFIAYINSRCRDFFHCFFLQENSLDRAGSIAHVKYACSRKKVRLESTLRLEAFLKTAKCVLVIVRTMSRNAETE